MTINNALELSKKKIKIDSKFGKVPGEFVGCNKCCMGLIIDTMRSEDRHFNYVDCYHFSQKFAPKIDHKTRSKCGTLHNAILDLLLKQRIMKI